jgi:hypothetical protein
MVNGFSLRKMPIYLNRKILTMVMDIRKICLTGLVVCLPFFVFAQKNIVISDSLKANADEMKVKMGGQGVGKTWKFRFGDYGIISSKQGWTTTSTKGNFFNTKTESKTTQKFSFVMAGGTGDTAFVNAASNIEVKQLQESELLNHIFVGKNEMLKESNNFSAFININGDTTNTWALLMNVIQGTQVEGNYSYEAFMTDGARKIFLVPATSNKNGDDKRSVPAAGYELVEDGVSIAAIQYYGGGMMGMNKNIIWINRNLDAKMKLILAASLSAVLQKKMNDMPM